MLQVQITVKSESFAYKPTTRGKWTESEKTS